MTANFWQWTLQHFTAFLCTCSSRQKPRCAQFVGIGQLSFFVGYAQNGLRNGGSMATPQFANIGASQDIPLQSIKPVGTDTSDNVSLQTLDSAGYTVDNYLWVNWAGDSGDQEAWIDSDTFEIVEGVTFAPGTGLWIQGSSIEQSVQSAGKVGTEDVVVALRNGGTIVGNPFPIATDLQDILPEGNDTSDNVSLQTLDSAGYTVDNYLWVNWAGDSGDQEAWIDSDTFEIVEDVSIPAGQGVWVQGSSTEQAIRFSAPELL